MNDKTNWPIVKFGDVVRQVKDKVNIKSSGLDRYMAGEHMDTDDLRIRRWGTIEDGYLGPAFHMRFKPGQVLYGSRRTYLRKVAVPDFEGICANTTFVLESKDSTVLLPELLPFIMQTEAFHDHSIKQSKGSVNPYVNFSDLAWYEFALPPMEEQRRIVNAMSLIDQVAFSLQDVISTALTAETALLKEVFGFYDNSLCRWPKVELRNLAFIQSGIAKGRQAESGKTIDVPYIGVANVQDGYLALTEIKTITVEINKIEQSLLRKGDVLLTEGGDPDKLGRGTVWQEEIEGCVHQNHIFAVRPNDNKLQSWFLAAITRSTYAKQYFLSCAKRTSNLATINKQQVGSFLVPLPNLWEQEQIVVQWQSIRSAVENSTHRFHQIQLFRSELMRCTL